MFNENSSPILNNVVFSENRADYGGGMSNDNNSSPILSNVVFSKNEADYGGGIYETNASFTLINVTFSGNKANNWGGGVYTQGQNTPTLINVTFVNNEAANGGGMMVFTPLTLINVAFVGNKARNNGAGMFGSVGDFTFVNTLFWNNTGGTSSETAGQQIYLSNSGSDAVNMTISFSLVQNGIAATAGATADDNAADGLGIEGGTAPVTVTQAHNISGNPNLAADLADNGGFVQTMALLANSPAANAGVYVQRSGTAGSFIFYYSEDGTNWFSNPMLTDSIVVPADAIYLTDARDYIRNDRPDIGAYEYGGTAP